MKKILIALLSFLTLFLIGSKIKADANSEWTLEADGYYYYNQEIKFDGEWHTLESHNGNLLEVIQDGNKGGILLPFKVEIRAMKRNVDTAQLEWKNRQPFLEDLDGIDINSKVARHYYKENWDNPIPDRIRYLAEEYTRNYDGDLSLGGFNPTFLSITEEEYNNYLTLEKYQLGNNQQVLRILDDYTKANIHDPQYINFRVKHDVVNITTNSFENHFDFNDALFKVVQLKQDHITEYDTAYYITTLNNDDIIDIFDFQDLPFTAGDFENGLNGVGAVFINESAENFYEVQVNYLNKKYKLTIIDLPEYIALSKKVYYFTDKGQRYIVGFYESQAGYSIQDTLADDIIENSWIIWNITTGEYTRSETNTIHAKLTSKSKNIQYTNQLYAEIVIPHELDDLLSIAVAYEYRHVYLIGNKGAWKTVSEQILMKDEKSNFELPWYNSLFGFYNWAINSNRTTRELFGIDQIELIDTDVQYKNDYVNWMNERNLENGIDKVYTVNDIFIPNSKTYSLYLGTFNKFGSVNLDTRNFAVLKYRYEYKGVQYSNPFPKTTAPDNTENKSPADPVITWFKDLFSGIWSFIVRYAWIAIPIIGLISSPIIIKSLAAIFGRKVYKKRLIIVLGWVSLLLAIWFSLI